MLRLLTCRKVKCGLASSQEEVAALKEMEVTWIELPMESSKSTKVLACHKAHKPSQIYAPKAAIGAIGHRKSLQTIPSAGLSHRFARSKPLKTALRATTDGSNHLRALDQAPAPAPALITEQLETKSAPRSSLLIQLEKSKAWRHWRHISMAASRELVVKRFSCTATSRASDRDLSSQKRSQEACRKSRSPVAQRFREAFARLLHEKPSRFTSHGIQNGTKWTLEDGHEPVEDGRRLLPKWLS